MKYIKGLKSETQGETQGGTFCGISKSVVL